ncbi:transglutaminase domain-containing protein [Ichthyenterobacterium sp. W332]|uniref:Transglutaminase domain-containing protein n=1 Tax=Microcosmobacter mediterraneus TaxID=3075607 RepID=A0ABU2YPR6_9FLAO|nr:transglutaminase domain-containing protein [Ichthyenterobacterium sp. W332]MDT0559033.1 transglutaminase domain-containing protein [Ichthyenterobacterium sp. W332]
MKNLTILLCLVSMQLAFCQDFKFGKISKAELEEKVHPLDSTASAAVLYRKETVSFIYTQSDGFMQQREITERIKIYNKEGFDWATKKLYLYEGGSGSKEQLNGAKGYTYNLVSGKIEKEKLKKNGIFEEDFNEFTEINTITMPNIKEGCVIDYTYKIVSPFIVIDDLIFQYDIPINRLEMSVSTPEYYAYNKQFNSKAFFVPKLVESTSKGSARVTTSSRTNSTVSASRNYQQNSFEYKLNIIKINEDNVPALKTEPYSGNVNNYRSKMSIELAAILNQYGATEKSFSTNWEKVSKTIYESSDFGNQLNRSGFFKNDVASIASNINDPFEKAFVLQSYVKSKVRWNGIYGYRAQKGTRKAYLEGEGNVADINLLLVAMLRSQGVNANPVLVSTRNNGIPLFPTRKGFNYVICIVENGDNYALLDASEPYSMINVLPERTLNWQGRVLKDDGSSYWITLRSNKKATEATSLNVKLNTDLSASGKVRQSITSYTALNYRNRYGQLAEADHIKSLEKNKGDIVISNLIFDNKTDITQPVKITYDYELSDAMEEIGDKLYFSPLLFLATEESPFKLDERKYPIDFVIPFEDKYLINIMLPEGYTVESMPESIAYEFGDNGAKFSYVAKLNGKYLQLSVNLDLKSSIILPKDYVVFKDFFENIVEKQTEQIVLTKS